MRLPDGTCDVITRVQRDYASLTKSQDYVLLTKRLSVNYFLCMCVCVRANVSLYLFGAFVDSSQAIVVRSLAQRFGHFSEVK